MCVCVCVCVCVLFVCVLSVYSGFGGYIARTRMNDGGFERLLLGVHVASLVSGAVVPSALHKRNPIGQVGNVCLRGSGS